MKRFHRCVGAAVFDAIVVVAATALAHEPAPGFKTRTSTVEPATTPSTSVSDQTDSRPKEVDDEGTIPPGYTAVQRQRLWPLIVGPPVLALNYTIAAATAANAFDKHELGALWVPVVGPFITMARTNSAVGNLLLSSNGVGQVAGLVLTIYGLASPKTVLVRTDLAQVKIRLRAAPVVASTAAGFGIVGSF